MKHFILAIGLALLAGCSSSPEETAATTAPPMTETEVTALRTKLGGLSEEFAKPLYEQAPSNEFALIARTKWYADMGVLLEKGNESGDSVCRKLSAGLSPRLVAKQRAGFPKMRENYVSLLKGDPFLRTNGATVDSKPGTITLTANGFTDPGKQNQIQQRFASKLKALRFKQMNLVWGKKSNEWRPFPTGAISDAEISTSATGQ